MLSLPLDKTVSFFLEAEWLNSSSDEVSPCLSTATANPMAGYAIPSLSLDLDLKKPFLFFLEADCLDSSSDEISPCLSTATANPMAGYAIPSLSLDLDLDLKKPFLF